MNISSVKVDKFSDSYFGKAKAKKGKKGKEGDEMFAEKEEKSELKPERVADQKEVDAALKVEPMVGKYLKARFSLSKRDAPHKMCF